jgi:hypothetical protein
VSRAERAVSRIVVDDSSIPFIAAGYIELIKKGEAIVNKEYYFIEIDTSHSEVSDILTEEHGKKPKFISWSDAELHEALNAQPGTALMAAILRKSGEDGWVYPGERVEVPGWKGRSLRHWVRDAIARE